MSRIEDVLSAIGPSAIAVSGGIDSLTLATAAHRRVAHITLYHAVSPAVPPDATGRTKRLAESEGWRLVIFDAGEFQDPHYRQNPVNRCLFCKTNLYGAIAGRTGRPILSGTNLDDLGEFRPGLQAASQHSVRHPFVEASMRKADVRQLAASLGLGALAELPSSPCLSSRVETGLRIEAADLDIIHRVETLVASTLSLRTVRCRKRRAGFCIELDDESLARLTPDVSRALSARIASLGVTGAITFAPYRNGSAFLHRTAP